MSESLDLPGAYMRELVELAARWDVPAEVLLDGLPVTLRELGAPATRVPLPVCEAIASRALALTNEPALPLYLGLQMRVSSHGFLGFAAMTASTVREAIELAARYASTRTTAIGIALYVEGDRASLVIEERADLGQMREPLVLGLVAGLWQLGQALTGKPLDGSAECAFPEPPLGAIRSSPLASRIAFDCPANRLVFSAAVLDTPLVSADPVAMELARTQCERELAAIADGSFVGRVRAAIAAQVERAPAVPAIARALHVSTRTLKRRLAEQGTTFSAILDDVRRQRALLLIADRGLSVGEVAARVGYRELPSFTRAFRKWTGMTPVAYRAR